MPFAIQENSGTAEQAVLTVSIAAYNAEAFISRCLESCVGLEPGQLDVIIVDDGSTDKTGEIADSFAEKYPATFRVVHKSNGHYGSTVNSSLPLARGKYYRLLDSDDWFDREALEQWLRVLSRSEADVATTSSMWIMEKSERTVVMDSWAAVPAGEYAIDELPVSEVPGPGISNLAYRTDFLTRMSLSLLEQCNYVDEELRCIPWCHVRTVRVDHFPVYRVLKERDGQNTSFEGIRRSAPDKGRMFFHLMDHAHLGSEGLRTKAQKMAFKVAVEDVAAGYYYNMMLLEPSRSTKREIIKFDTQLRKLWPEIYYETGRSFALIRLLRATKFIMLAPLAYRTQRKRKG